MCAASDRAAGPIGPRSKWGEASAQLFIEIEICVKPAAAKRMRWPDPPTRWPVSESPHLQATRATASERRCPGADHGAHRLAGWLDRSWVEVLSSSDQPAPRGAGFEPHRRHSVGLGGLDEAHPRVAETGLRCAAEISLLMATTSASNIRDFRSPSQLRQRWLRLPALSVLGEATGEIAGCPAACTSFL